MKPWHVIVVILSVTIGALRILGFRSPAYQANAHIFVGIIFWAWVVARERRTQTFLVVTLIALTVLETLCFLWFKSQAQFLPPSRPAAAADEQR